MHPFKIYWQETINCQFSQNLSQKRAIHVTQPKFCGLPTFSNLTCIKWCLTLPYIPSRAIDQKPKVWRRGQRQRRRSHDPYVSSLLRRRRCWSHDPYVSSLLCRWHNKYLIASIIVYDLIKTHFQLDHYQYILKGTIFYSRHCSLIATSKGGQWLSGRVLDLRLKGHGFEPHQSYCVVSLSKTHQSLLSTGSTQENLSRHNWKIVDWDVKNQIK